MLLYMAMFGLFCIDYKLSNAMGDFNKETEFEAHLDDFKRASMLDIAFALSSVDI